MARPLPSLNALRAFEAAARLGSVSQAAVELHVTHGAVSRHVRALEEALGRPLFVRDGRGLALTTDGHRLRDTAGEAFGVLQAGWTALQRGPRAAALVLGCPGSLLARWVIPRLERLATELPDLRLHLSAQEGTIDLAAAGLDAALLLGEAPWPAGWQVWPLAPERIGPVLSPRHARFDALRDASPEALLDEPLLHTTSRPQAWPRWLAAQHLADTPRLGTGFDHLTYLLEAAVAGLGVAIAPRELVLADLDSGRLVAPWGFIDTGGTWALCAARGNPDTRFALLADWLRRDLASAS
ncbi:MULTISPECIES: LysR family transcriptional regulator [unclassified Pseudoxanthomonas]|uniref:LysR family transcriptional regulator n=1 Tax=unclassified Pseudoxanthomonas TaxID=2645906 RepID=UPI0008E332BE|nr:MULTISPECIES: LysR family transcriptional regulator [unclassified Pseudoxanthomonas]PPJ43793.1 LysR family transcriptional regulator [Pseudoxanthomonas sp. KAs_5_3]SFV36278.1 transcriptional regulator [Pseudoxanthomonas sp. YR558]